MDIVQAIKEVGFPAVAFYLMYRFATTTLAKNTEVLGELRDVIKEFGGYLARLVGNGFAASHQSPGEGGK